MEEDFSEMRMSKIAFANVTCGVPAKDFDTTDTLYYDESGNSRLFWLKNGKYNVDANTHFVLGGIQSEEKISFDELRKELNLNITSKEAKSSALFKGTFEDALTKNNFSLLMDLIHDRKWHIHFFALNMLYYSLVDIVDSINLNENALASVFQLKNFIYHVFKDDIHKSESFLIKFSYPNIPSDKANEFLDGLIKVMQNFNTKNCTWENIVPAHLLIPAIKASKNEELTFIQDEQTNMLIKEFDQFYMQELWKFYKATLIFDEEVHVKPTLEGTDIVVNGGHVNNWTMINSMDEPLVQVSDLVVGLLSKYFVFLDNSIADVEAVVNSFNHNQLSNFQQWQEVLQDSFDYNKSFFEMTVSLEQSHNLFKMLEIK